MSMLLISSSFPVTGDIHFLKIKEFADDMIIDAMKTHQYSKEEMNQNKAHMILYVIEQERSKSFYEAVLNQKPSLHVAGMTEFQLNTGFTLGLMPMANIKKLLGEKLPDPSSSAGVPRAELYMYVDNVNAFHARALANGATELDSPRLRNWGDLAAYSLDPDGHVLAFASKDELR